MPANQAKVIRAEAVGPRVGAELKTKAFTAILISFLVTLIYLAFRFEWRFGVAAVVATAHDILTTMAFLAMMHLEVSLTVVAALLTVIGYSLNDTIIIFDRVRENLKKQRKESLRDVLNRSINETLPRSVLTHTTVLAATLALLIFAGEVMRPFSWIMAFGVFTGTFSSVYVAGAILLWIEHKWPRKTDTENKGTARALAEERRRERPTPSRDALTRPNRRTAASRGGSCIYDHVHRQPRTPRGSGVRRRPRGSHRPSARDRRARRRVHRRIDRRRRARVERSPRRRPGFVFASPPAFTRTMPQISTRRRRRGD